jgi:hypothetical protein
MFAGRRLLIATKHKKEQVIAPLLEEALGVTCFTDPSFDTDVFGTFTGEVERTDDPLTVLRNKCLRAMEQQSCDLVVASEGSFGPHPALVFVQAGDEWMMLMDRTNNLELIVREISTDTNFDGRTVHSSEELDQFLTATGFPQHAVILRKNRQEATDIHKGVTSREEATRIFRLLHEKYGAVYVETDMRALYNPTRMNNIRLLTQQLIQVAQSNCPSCGRPGFTQTETVPGLPCSNCHLPTRSPLKYISRCAGCSYTEETLYPKGKKEEDPMWCDYCNP